MKTKQRVLSITIVLLLVTALSPAMALGAPPNDQLRAAAEKAVNWLEATQDRRSGMKSAAPVSIARV